MSDVIRIRHASQNNLKDISLEIPKNQLVVVTGVSGSGKSSLVYDVIYREAENRYLGTFSAHARQLMGKTRRPEVESIEGLSPAIAVNQKTVIRSARSTVGTITGIYDYLRLLMARFGHSDDPKLKIQRSLFSFNSPQGACMHCQGLGVEDRIDPQLLIADGSKSLRQGAFVITAPNGYIIYSQVTMDVLDEVCRAEGFSVDIPWNELTESEQQVVLYGSNKVEIPFGKHTLESRMRWSGITAKPRDMGFYKGVIPVMNEILRRDRNKNILRFVRTHRCSECHGTRLNTAARSVRWHGKNIAQLAALSLRALSQELSVYKAATEPASAEGLLLGEILKRTHLLEKLGVGYLSTDRESTTLSGGESQRLRLAAQITAEMNGVLYIFDEPSIGLHPTENKALIDMLFELRDQGNTVIVVEHDDEYLRHADHVIDLGPAAGIHGGELLINHPAAALSTLKVTNSSTLDFLLVKEVFFINKEIPVSGSALHLIGASLHNLKKVSAHFYLHALNVITGVSGAGKSSLMQTLAEGAEHLIQNKSLSVQYFEKITGWEQVQQVVMIDQAPIGRTPRSNPATYTGMFDYIRDLFAALPESKKRGWKKGQFSFNVAGGRCEVCQGAGYQQVGMHFMGNVEIVCESCNGRRFNEETLQATYRGLNIYDVLELSVEEALDFFSAQPAIRRIAEMLVQLGLGYLKLGQRSTTLSGGEAQRIKLATALARPSAAHTLYLLDEPTIGLHHADVKVLLEALRLLTDQGNTVVVIEHHAGVVAAAGHIIDLGPGSGEDGGTIIFEGHPTEILHHPQSLTGKALAEFFNNKNRIFTSVPPAVVHPNIRFRGVTTHNLKNIDVEILKNKITVITGVSGSGKSSLAFDTLYAESSNRFLECFSPYVRAQVGMRTAAGFDSAEGITPAIAIHQRSAAGNVRSTVGTVTGIYDLYRLLFSRIGRSEIYSAQPFSSLFSFNHQQGACKSCDGLGTITICDSQALISNPERPLTEGAMGATKWGKFYGDPHGQHVHTLLAAGKRLNLDFSKPYHSLSEKEKQVALNGTGDEVYSVSWHYKRGVREGTHHFEGTWPGLAHLVEEEYHRKHADHRGEAMMEIMKMVSCPDCRGARLNETARSFQIAGCHIGQLADLSINEAIEFFTRWDSLSLNEKEKLVARQLVDELLPKLGNVQDLGLGYLQVSRGAVTLSGGEAQRVRLAAQIGNGLTGVTCVLDEPTTGLHPHDTGRLIELLRRLRNAGNTVVVVEHDRDIILAADQVLELGPGAGEQGGNLLACGTPEQIKTNTKSITGKYLLDEKKHLSNSAPPANLSEVITMHSAFANNLKNIDLHIPTRKIVTISGVSGSGKSTLLFEVIAASAAARQARGCKKITGLDQFDEVAMLTQKAAATSQSSNLLTLSGMFDRVRAHFAKTPEAIVQKLRKTHFSFNTSGGRCEKCQGKGEIQIALDFMSDVTVVCDECKGKRYQSQVLACRINNKNIYDLLETSVAEAIDFFYFDKQITEALKVMQRVGLGYLCCGQATSTLSGGELQRLLLAVELLHSGNGHNLYLLDEPTRGLHFKDVEMLMHLFRQLADHGQTLIIIEHNLDVIAQSDFVIDLGPGAGAAGGNIVALGTPTEIIHSHVSLTAEALRMSWWNKEE
ncbi:MAG TPA: excinuclease ABC subunit UvrA [Bacteroidales bacterium]|nr:excinuclease ABC subunit UvrA [Bacteroidales bacterium]